MEEENKQPETGQTDPKNAQAAQGADDKAKGQPETSEDIDKVKGVSAVAYLGILFFVPLLTNPESKFAKFHANQGLLLLITSIAVNVIGSMLMIVLIGFLLVPLGNLFVLVLFIMGIMNALNGKMQPLPLIGNITLLK